MIDTGTTLTQDDRDIMDYLRDLKNRQTAEAAPDSDPGDEYQNNGTAPATPAFGDTDVTAPEPVETPNTTDVTETTESTTDSAEIEQSVSPKRRKR